MLFFKNRKLYKFYIIILFTILFALILFATTQGTIKIPVFEVARIMAARFFFIKKYVNTEYITDSNIFIVFNIRLPRIIIASLVGAVLSLVGTSYQAIFKNPMADPFVMGASSGAAFGATIATVLGANRSFLGFGIISLLAFFVSLLTTIFVYHLARIGNKISTTSILLAGIVVSTVLSSFVRFMMIFNHDELARIVNWRLWVALMGQIGGKLLL